MKKLILTLGIFLSGIVCLQAQEAQGGNQDKQVANITSKLTTACHLTSDQVTKIQPFVKQFVQTRNDNKEKLSSNKEALKTANKANRQQLAANLKTILSADQMQEFKSWMQQQIKANPTPAPSK